MVIMTCTGLDRRMDELMEDVSKERENIKRIRVEEYNK